MGLFSKKKKCTNCKKEIAEGKGVRYSGKDFCSPKCMNAWKKEAGAGTKSKDMCEFC